MDQFLGRVLGNRYEIVEKIGEGGMALVYKAQCRLLNRFVAIKILRPEFIEDDEFIQKFDKESKAAASLSHPAIVNVYDVGSDGDVRYIVMEYINGVTLKKYIKDYPGFLSNREIISIAKQISLALDHAHQNHIIHRDIKPHNILISEEGIVKVADFGIARAITTSTIINTTDMMGSVHYASPEQARGGFVDERSDLYSLGIMLYELSTKRVPFDGDSPVAVAMKHLKDEIVLPSAINPEISYGLESVIMKAIQRAPEKRYQSALQLIEDLEDVLINPDLEIFLDGSDESSPTMVMPNLGEMEPLDEAFNERTRPLQSKKTMGSPANPRPIQQKSADNFRPDKKKFFLTIGLAFLSVVIIAVLALKVPQMLDSGKLVDMPNVVGLDYKAATEQIEELGLKVDISEHVESKEYDVDQVVSQSQPEHTKLKPGYTISLVISTGSEQVTMPNLVQKQLTEAQYLVENAGLKLGSVEYVQNDLPEGTIISQSPYSGLQVAPSTAVDLFVSKGKDPEKIVMPKLLGITYAEAQKRLTDSKITLGKVTYNFSDEYAKDVVMIQSVEAGKDVMVGDSVNLVVSKGKSQNGTTTNTNTSGNAGNSNSNNGNTNSGGSSAKKYYTVNIPLIGSSDVLEVRVVKIQNGSEQVVYQQNHNKSEGSVDVRVEGEGKASIVIYVGGTLLKSISESDVEFR